MSQLEGFYQQSYPNSPLNPQQQHSYPHQQQQQHQQHQQQHQQGFYGAGQPGDGSQGFSQFYNNQNQFQQQQFQHQRSVPPQHQPQQSPAPNQFGGLPNGVGSATDMMQSPFAQQPRSIGVLCLYHVS